MIILSIILATTALEPSTENAKVIVDTPALFHIFKAHGHENVINIFEKGDDLHHFSLRPSAIKKLTEADELVYTGPSVIPQLGDSALGANANIKITPLDQLENFDPHYWTSPLLFSDLLQITDKSEFNSFHEALKAKPYPYKILVDHEAYNPFIEAYKIEYLGALTNEHDHEAGASDFGALESKIDSNTCFISSLNEPNLPFEKIAASKGAKVVRHDPLGWDIEGEGMEFFEAYYAKLGKVFSECAD